MVATNDSVEGDDVGLLDIFSNVREVAVMNPYSLFVALPPGLLFQSLDMRRRGLHRDATGGTGLQQLVLDGANPSADVQQTSPLDSFRLDRLNQVTSRLARTVLAVVLEVFGSLTFVEKLFDALTLASIHGKNLLSMVAKV